MDAAVHASAGGAGHDGDRAAPLAAAARSAADADIAPEVPTRRQRPARTADDIRRDIERAEKDLDEAERDENKYEAVEDDPSRTADERTDAGRLLDFTLDIIRNLHGELNSLHREMLELDELSSSRTAQPPAPPVFATLKELIVAMGGQHENGSPRLNILAPPRRSPLSTEFRGRTSELKHFASHVRSNLTVASGDRAEFHPFFVTTALPGTGKTTFALESFARMREYLTGEAQDIVRNGVVICLNLNGGESSWRIADNVLDAEARLVARIVATVFLKSDYGTVWTTFTSVLLANRPRLRFRQLVPLVAAAQRAKLGLGRDAKVSALFVLDEFQHLGGDLSNAMRPVLTTMGTSIDRPRCFDSDGILVIPLLAGTSLEGARAVTAQTGHPGLSINLEPFCDSDTFAILRELLSKPTLALPTGLLDYFAPALDADRSIEALPARQLCFRGLVLDCGGNPSLLALLARQLAQYCNGRFSPNSNDFLDGLFLSFSERTSLWASETELLRAKVRALPKSLVPIVVASLPIHLDEPAVDADGKAMAQTWSQLLSSCGLSATWHPSFSFYRQWLVQVPYVLLYGLARETTAFVQLEACVDFPFLYRGGQAYANLVFQVHAQRMFHLLGASALHMAAVQFQDFFPGGFVPTSLAKCLVRLPTATAERDGHDVAGQAGKVDDIPQSALSGDVFVTDAVNHYHFEGRSALLVQLRMPAWTTALLLWQTKLVQPGSTTTIGYKDICAWHATARALTRSWTDAGTKVVFVLVLFRTLSAAATAANAEAVCDEVRQYAQASEDLVVVTKEHMGEYLAGLAHRLHVPLESTSTAVA